MPWRLSSLVTMVALFCVPLAASASPSMDDARAFFEERGIATDEGDRAVSRGEVLMALFDAQEETAERVAWHREHLSRLPLFTDVPPESPLAPYAEAAFERGMIRGFPDRTLRPDDPVTVEEAVTLLTIAYHEELPEGREGDPWFAPAIQRAIERNLIAELSSLYIGQGIAREQFLDMAYRMAIVQRDQLAAFPAPRPTVAAAPAVAAEVAAEPAIHQDHQPIRVALPASDHPDADRYRSGKNFAISIPALGIRDLTVTHPRDTQSKEGLLSVLKVGLGHLFSEPGRGGKIMIYGHSSNYAWDVSEFSRIFRQVHKLKPGDMVYVTHEGRLFAYQVTGKQTIAANDSSPFAGAGEELILYTCWPIGSNKSRLIVRAVPVDSVAVR